MMRLLRAAWDRLSLYLPIILMGVLALGTYWLVRSTPVFEVPGPEQAKKHEPDYFMQKFSVKTFNTTGQLKTEIFGSEGRHFPDTDTVEIDQVRIRSFNDKGHLTTATARQAVTNSDSSEVQLIGNAVVVREEVVDKNGKTYPRLTYRSEFLHAYMDTERVTSHKPVELTRGNDRFTAERMDYDNIDQIMQLQGRVRGVLVPKSTK